MNNIRRKRKRYTEFVDGLTPSQTKEQLVLAYLQMENCRSLLRGENAEPVSMMDNGDSSDLELFYQCKKVREELDYLDDEVLDDDDVDNVFVLLSGSTDEAYQFLHDLFMEETGDFFKSNPARIIRKHKKDRDECN